jgi:hypothetical protein
MSHSLTESSASDDRLSVNPGTTYPQYSEEVMLWEDHSLFLDIFLVQCNFLTSNIQQHEIVF